MTDRDQKIHSKNSFDDFGPEYQQQLIHEFITDKRFGQSIAASIKAEFFKDPAYSFIVKNIIRYYEKHDVIPNYDVLAPELRINMNHDNTFATTVLDSLNIIRKTEFVNPNIKSTAIKFCNLMALRDHIDAVKFKIDRGEISEYETISEGFKKILIEEHHDDSINVFDNIELALNEEDRNAVPTGVDAIDLNTKGGLGKGEVGLLIAPTGVGKTTLLSKIANSGQLAGKNILQIFFEDKYTDIQRKHLSCYSGIQLSELKNNETLVIERAREVQKQITGNLVLHKFPAEGVTMAKIKALIKKVKASGIKLDLVIVDYLECILPSGGNRDGEEWVGEGRIMRQFETVCEDEEVGGWIATQGTKLSTNIDVVKIEHMGGNIKKAQIGHFIMGIAKPLELREAGKANISILKNRLGPDGMIYHECEFDNDAMRISTGESNTLLGFANIKQDNVEAIALAAIKKSRSEGDAAYDEFFTSKNDLEQKLLTIETNSDSGSTVTSDPPVTTNTTLPPKVKPLDTVKSTEQKPVITQEVKPPQEARVVNVVEDTVIKQPPPQPPPQNSQTLKGLNSKGIPLRVLQKIYGNTT